MPTVDQVKAAVGGTKPKPKLPEQPAAVVEPVVSQEPPAAESAPAKPEPPAKPELKRFRVELVFNPPLVVEAWDRLDAIDKYKAHNGILATPHPFKVEDA